MIDELGEIATVGTPAPAFLRVDGLGAGLRGTIAPATVTIREELTPSEWSAIESGRYLVGVKLYKRDGVAGLVLELSLTGSRLQFFLNYSLAHVAAVGGPEAVAEIVDSLETYKQTREPGLGLLVFLVFLGLDEPQTIRALRAFVLPRMFGDRFLAAVESTVGQDLEPAAAAVIELFGDTSKAWANALPGVAVAGEELELSEGEYVRVRRGNRTRGRK
jgi:hypothetical protein